MIYNILRLPEPLFPKILWITRLRGPLSGRGTGDETMAGGTRNGRRGGNVLERLDAAGAARGLRRLLDRHPELAGEAEELAAAEVCSVDADEIAGEVAFAVLESGYEELNARAGRHEWGYTDPATAAWEILEEAVQPFLDDLETRIELGFEQAALEVCQGIVVGLYRTRGRGDDRVLGWAEDFPSEGAAEAVRLLASQSVSMQGRKWRLADDVLRRMHEWRAMLERAAQEDR